MERRIFDRASRLPDHDDTNVNVRDRSETSTQSIPKLTLFFFIFLHFQYFRWRKGNELHRQGGEKKQILQKNLQLCFRSWNRCGHHLAWFFFCGSSGVRGHLAPSDRRSTSSVQEAQRLWPSRNTSRSCCERLHQAATSGKPP